MYYFDNPDDFKDFLMNLIDAIEDGEFDGYDTIGAEPHINFHPYEEQEFGHPQMTQYHPTPVQQLQLVQNMPYGNLTAAFNIGCRIVLWQATRPTPDKIQKIIQAYKSGSEWFGFAKELGCYIIDNELENSTDLSDYPSTLRRALIKLSVIKDEFDVPKVINEFLKQNNLKKDAKLGTVSIYRPIKNKQEVTDQKAISTLSKDTGFYVDTDTTTTKKDLKRMVVSPEDASKYVKKARRSIMAAEFTINDVFEIYTTDQSYGRIMGTLIGIQYDKLYDDYNVIKNATKAGVPVSFLRSWIPGETCWSIEPIMGGGNPPKRFGPMYIGQHEI